MRAWLHERDVTLEERDFFRDPFTEAELRALLASVLHEPVLLPAHPELVEGHERDNGPATLLFSWKSPSFKSLGLSPDSLDAEALIRLMLREPRLIRRPIVHIGDRLIIGADWLALEAALRSP
ncbi:MAG: ArsC/Spx/MgsR family protein [Dehalococcoidia bacterium]|nr:ArsC/Spx/MgsR family protein [Dehalococcoidia bacterium]